MPLVPFGHSQSTEPFRIRRSSERKIPPEAGRTKPAARKNGDLIMHVHTLVVAALLLPVSFELQVLSQTELANAKAALLRQTTTRSGHHCR